MKKVLIPLLTLLVVSNGFTLDQPVQDMYDKLLPYCLLLGANPHIVVSILMVENPTLNPTVKSPKNANGSHDLGLFQLNSNYINWFLEKYWEFEFPFVWSNWTHNSYVAIKHIAYLQRQFGDITKISIAYNMGIAGSSKNPSRGRAYSNSVYRNYLEII
jgi:hypothetical protein